MVLGGAVFCLNVCELLPAARSASYSREQATEIQRQSASAPEASGHAWQLDLTDPAGTLPDCRSRPVTVCAVTAVAPTISQPSQSSLIQLQASPKTTGGADPICKPIQMCQNVQRSEESSKKARPDGPQ